MDSLAAKLRCISVSNHAAKILFITSCCCCGACGDVGKPSCMFASRRSIRFCTIARAARCNMPCGTGLPDNPAAHLDITPKTLRLAAIAGEIEALHPLPDGPWLFKRTDIEGPAAKNLTKKVRKRQNHPTGPSAEQQSLFISTA